MDIRQDVTNRILEAIAAGTVPWRKPWSSSGGLPSNAASGKAYAGINVILLHMCGYEGGYDDDRYLTFKQAEALGYRVNAGEKAAAHIVKYVEVSANKARKDGTEIVSESEDGKHLAMKTYAVFNVSQLNPPFPALPKTAPSVEPVAAAMAVIDGLRKSGLQLQEGRGLEACYIPSRDTIRMPSIAEFHGEGAAEVAANHAGTLLHEASHATGSVKRLGRFSNDGGAITTEERAREEMIAELSAAMISARCGIVATPDSIGQNAAYLKSWVEALKSDKNAIFKAASAAQKSCDHLALHALEPFQKLIENRQGTSMSAEPRAPTPAAAPPAPSVARMRM